MKGLKNRTLIFLAFLVVGVSLFLSWMLGDYKVLVSGLTILIILTTFIGGWRSTLYMGIFSLVLVAFMSYLYPPDTNSFLGVLLTQLFSFGLIAFSLILVFYLKKLMEEVNLERTHMESLFQNSTEGILLTDKQGQIVMSNPAAEKMFGYDKGEMIGKKIEVLIPQRYHPSHSKQREGFYHQPSDRPMGKGRDLFARRKNEEEFPVEISLGHYTQQDQFYVIAFIIDITIRKEIERSLDKEKELNEIKSRFLSMASHEFRTPLSTILSSASLISKYPLEVEQDKREKHLDRIKESVRHLNQLLEDFLSLGKLEEGKVGIHPSTFSVVPFIEDVVDEMRALLKEGQEIKLDVTNCGDFHTDKNMLKNILLNLLSNGIKFSPNDSQISLRIHCENNKMLIEIKDQGIGIPKEEQSHLFSTFFRASNVSNIQGTGLGLSIVKRYIELLQGTIKLHSEKDAGTTIQIEITPF